MPTLDKLNKYFNTHITKIILKVPEALLIDLQKKNYLVIDDYNKELQERLLTAAFGGLYEENEVPKWIKNLKLL